MLIQKDRLTIGEVARVTGVAVHTIRYWENEFRDYVRPERTNGGQRRYREADVSRLLEIRRLLKEDKYSIAGARQVLARE